ncbi:MAG: neutral zinc metallopeptidase [Candidatus Promineifilaceae bacterium]
MFSVSLLQNISTGTVYAADDCVIPDSGPWPPCATDGNSSPGNSNDCVIPDSGPWPPCATDGNNAPPTTGNSDGCVIPSSGPWPPCATQNGGGGAAPAPAPAPSSDGECVIPSSGPWPPCATQNSGGAAPAPRVSIQEIRARIDLGLEQLQTFWQVELREQGVNYRPPSRVVTYVGDPNDQPNAFYIPAMDAVFIDLRLLQEVSDQFGVYASVTVLAHEWGHFIQDQLNLLSQQRPLRRIELQADCFAGAFTKGLQNIGQLGSTEYESGRQLIFSVGDDIIDPSAPYNRPGAHGTAIERQTAYEYGFNNDDNACLSQYH